MNAPWHQKLGWRAEALAWDGYEALFRSMGIDRASDAGASLMRRLGPMTPVHRVARINMERVFPQASKPEIDRLLSRMWDNFGRFVGENPNMSAVVPPKHRERIEVRGAQHIQDLTRQGKPYVLISGHFANWEMLGPPMIEMGLNCRVTYRHANNPLIDQRILAGRAEYGMKVLTAKGGVGAKELLKCLSKGTAVALMNDQKMNDGIAVPFFGHDAMTAPGPARMAMRAGLEIIPVVARRLEGATFRVTFYDPIEQSTLPDKTEALRETVTNISRWVEDRILEAPEQWFWVHRRWDKSIYRKGAGSTSSTNAGSI